MGPPGPRGESGQKGDRGTTGQVGRRGERGLPGASGSTGLKGQHGDTGAMGPPGEPGLTGFPGLKGDRGLRGDDGMKGQKGEPYREWCNLCNLTNSTEIITKTLLSTSKNIIMLKPNVKKNFYDAESLCKQICGRIYFPSSLPENNELFGIALKGGFSFEDIWLRLTDEETEGTWKDPENRETVTFQNWQENQPNNLQNKQHHVSFRGTLGEWGDLDAETFLVTHVICEL